MTCYKVYPNLLNRLKIVEKFHRLKTQSIFSEPSQPESMARTIRFSNRNFPFSHVNGSTRVVDVSLVGSPP